MPAIDAGPETTLKLYRVTVMLDHARGSRWHDGRTFLAVGEDEVEAARKAMEAHVRDNPHDVAPLGAVASEAEDAVHALPERFDAVLTADVRRIARGRDWVPYEPPPPAPRP